MGWTARELSEISLAFVEFARSAKRPVLDIGAGFGPATLAALKTGAHVIANDLDEEHLAELWKHCPEVLRSGLQLKTGEFPRHLHFEEHSLDAVHAAAVFHFLNGRKLEHGFRNIGRWLAPGGKLFVEASTPWQEPFRDFIPEYETRLSKGAVWPGWVVKIGEFSKHRQLGLMPRSIHLLDPDILSRLCGEGGLEVERVWLHRRRDLPVQLTLDGRETVGLIARKV